jgi:hypothetical protein
VQSTRPEYRQSVHPLLFASRLGGISWYPQ